MANTKIKGGAAIPVALIGAANLPDVIPAGAIPVIDVTSLELALGNLYLANVFDLSLANSSTINITMTTPSNRNVFLTNVISGVGTSTGRFLENVTIDTPGSSFLPVNLNRQQPDGAFSIIQLDALFSGGDTIYNILWPSGERSNAAPFNASSGLGIILKRSTIYVIELTNQSGGASAFQLTIQFTEADTQ